MRILITGAASPLARAIIDELGGPHSLRLLDSTGLQGDARHEIVEASLSDAAALWQALRGVDALIHTGEAPADLPQEAQAREQALLDLATRGTHILCQAAVEAGVRRIVYGSTLDLFEPYPDEVYISEMWKPRPGPQMPVMSRYLGELTCREFAREHPVTVTALRLGRIVSVEEAAARTPDPMWLEVRDAARAFAAALERDAGDQLLWTRRWGLYHICHLAPNPRYLIDHAAQLGFAPQHNFTTLWEAA